jgi:ABC-type lipoprotein export system ATPase subunit
MPGGMSIGTKELPQHGARFFACDLHAHTPSDREWHGERPAPGERAAKEYAVRYVETCLQAGMEVLGLVDHNLAPALDDSLEPIILKEARRQGLWVFPGAEITSSEGAHVVFLFDPAAEFDTVEKFVVAAFRSQPRFDSQGQVMPAPMSLSELLKLAQEFAAFFYFPHANKSNGLFQVQNGRRTIQRIYEEETPVLALDLGDHPLMAAPEVRLSSAIPGVVRGFQHSGWRRKCPFPPALLWNSDGRCLPGGMTGADEGRRAIGQRFTWIKMSEPSVFALKVAVLDPESRIRHPPPGATVAESRPAAGHAHIASMRIQGVDFFQQSMQVRFSPHLNCIIGGRGSGKSNLLSLLRYALRQDTDESFGKARKAAERHQSLLYGSKEGLKLLSRKEAHVTAEFNSAGELFSVERGVLRESIARPVNGQPLEGSGVSALCRAKVFSQGQIEEIASQPALQLSILDDFLRGELRQATNAEELARNELLGLQAERLKLTGTVAKLQEARANLAVAQNKLKQLSGRQDVALEQQQRLWAAEARYFDGVASELKQEAARLKSVAEEAASVGTSLDLQLQQSPRVSQLRAFEQEANRLCEALREKWRGAVEEFERGLALLGPSEQWKTGHETFQAAWKASEATLSQAGLKLSDSATLRQEELQWQRQVELLEKAAAKLVAVEQQVEAATKKLRAAWHKSFTLRAEKAEQLTEAIQRVEIAVRFAADGEELDDQLVKWFQGANLQEEPRKRLREKLLPASGESDDYPLQELVKALRQGREWLAEPGRDKLPETHALRARFELSDIMAPKLCRGTRPEVLDEMERYRTPDLVEIRIRDAAGSPSIRLDDASFGQRCAAVLSLLLAEGEDPVIIDQPEDDLDNEGIYHWIVQGVFRVQKFRRQLIVVTHNANILVNGDAEMVIALERKCDETGRVTGHIKKVVAENGRPLEVKDSFDRSQTRKAVAEILEGGEAAFELRGLKYGMEVPRV